MTSSVDLSLVQPSNISFRLVNSTKKKQGIVFGVKFGEFSGWMRMIFVPWNLPMFPFSNSVVFTSNRHWNGRMCLYNLIMICWSFITFKGNRCGLWHMHFNKSWPWSCLSISLTWPSSALVIGLLFDDEWYSEMYLGIDCPYIFDNRA